MSGNAKFRWSLLAPILVALFVVVNSPVISWSGELEDAEELVRQNPNYAPAYFELGVIYTGLKRYEEAIASYKEALRIDPDYTLARNNLNELEQKMASGGVVDQSSPPRSF